MEIKRLGVNYSILPTPLKISTSSFTSLSHSCKGKSRKILKTHSVISEDSKIRN